MGEEVYRFLEESGKNEWFKLRSRERGEMLSIYKKVLDHKSE